jgi:hypothetical protein
VSTREEHERGLIRAFILPERQERYLELLAKPKRRKDIPSAFAHFKHLDLRFAVAIPPSQQHAKDITQILKSRQAPNACFALSEDTNLDGREVPLAEALESIVGYGMGTFLSCIPGQLGYFEDEDQRWILEPKSFR